MTEPTDNLQQRCAEIVEWQRTGVLSGSTLRNHAKTHWAGYHDSLQMAERDTFTKAVEWVAKWGTSPAVAGEAAEHYRNAIASACEGWTMPDGLRKHLETALWSPPTQAAPPAGREPLTDEQRSDIATAAAGFNWTDDYVEAIDYVIDGVESLHGIKGGQHGTE